MAELKDYILEHFVKGKDIIYTAKELVRCKDCKYYVVDNCGDFLINYCELSKQIHVKYFYCKFGERKEDNDS